MTKVAERKKVLAEFTMMRDIADIPYTNDILPWWYFNSNYYSHDRTYKEIEEIAIHNLGKLVDVRPYMIETPFLA